MKSEAGASSAGMAGSDGGLEAGESGALVDSVNVDITWERQPDLESLRQPHLESPRPRATEAFWLLDEPGAGDDVVTARQLKVCWRNRVEVEIQTPAREKDPLATFISIRHRLPVRILNANWHLRRVRNGWMTAPWDRDT